MSYKECKHEFMPCECGCGEPRCMYCDNSKMIIDDLKKEGDKK